MIERDQKTQEIRVKIESTFAGKRNIFGTIEIGNVEFSYEVYCADVGMGTKFQLCLGNDWDSLKKYYTLSLKGGEAKIDLTEEENAIFCSLLYVSHSQMLIDFSNKQPKAFKDFSKGKVRLMTFNYNYANEVSVTAIEILRREKFGCQF